MAEENASSQSSKASQNTEPRPKKRAAVNPNHQACTACKRRKVRCDAAQPRCSYCATHDKPCIFPPVWKRAKCSQSHVDDLEMKLRQYESRYGRPKSAAFEDYPASQNETSTLTVQDQHSTAFAGATGATVCEPPIEVQGSLVVSDSQTQVNPQVAQHLLATNDPTASGDFDQQAHPQWIRNLLSPEKATNAAFPSRVDRTDNEIPNPSQQSIRHEPSDKDGINNTAQGAPPTTAPGPGDDSDVDQDSEADHQIMDGMVEYVGSSPEDVQAEDTFDTSPTFNFALKIKASTLGKGVKFVSSRADIPNLREKAATASSTLVDPASNSSNISTTVLRREQAPQQDTFHALKFYFNQSYLQYVPQRMVAKALLDRYFAAANSVWPFLNEDVTRHRYDQLCSSDEPPSPIWMSQLNLVFALACQFYETEAGAPLPDVYDAGKQYYLRGHGYLIAHAFDTCSIAMLQSLLLAVQYQQGTTRSNECWLTTGHATRMALGLGVHMTPSPNSGLSPLDIEIRKRLWWGCFSLDRVCSMIYGRPIGIPHIRVLSSQNSLPQPVDDNYIAIGKGQPDNSPSVNAFFVCAVSLYLTMDKIIEELHQISPTTKSDPNCNHRGDKQDSTNSCSCDAVTQLSAIIQLDGHLQKWHDTLPPHLKFSLDDIDPEDGYPHGVQRQKVILKIRFLGMRILLHRQSILFLLQNPEKRCWPRNASKKWPPLFSDDATELVAGSLRDDQGTKGISNSYFETQLAHLSAKLCVKSAQLQIEMIDHSRRSKLTGAWWWDFHFIFNALCVLCGAMGLRKEDRSVVVPALSKAQSLMQRGVSNIHDMAARGGPKVARSERFLRRLMKAASEQAHEPPTIARQGPSSDVAKDNNDQATARLAVESLPQVPSGTIPPTPMGLFGDDFLGPMDGLDWSPSVDNAFANEMAQNSYYLYGNANPAGTPYPEDNPVRNLLQTSFDTWTALGGAFQPPIDMEPVW